MTDHIESDLKTLHEELEDLREDLRNLAATLQTLVRHGKSEAGARLDDLCANIPSDLRKITSDAKAHIETKPLTSALASFGVGMLVGMILNGRRTPTT